MTAQAPSPGGFGPLLANRSFLVMWIGQCFSQVADKLVFILLVEIVGELSSSPRVMSVALALHTAPNVLLGAPAGVFVDRLDKRAVMIATNVARAGFVVLLGLFGHVHVAVAIGLAFVVASCAQPFIPAEGAAMPLVVAPEHLLQANSVFATTMIASIIVAFTLGEPLVQAVGTQAAAFVVGAGFLVSVGFLWFVRYAREDVHAAEHAPFLKALREGFAFIRDSRPVRRTLGQQVALFAMFAAMSVLAIIFAKTVLKTNFSWFLAAAGAGMGLGAWLVGRLDGKLRRDTIVVAGFTTVGAALFGLAATGASQKGVAFAIAVVIGLASALVAVPLQTRLQELVPEHLRGKVFGAQNMALNVATTAPLAAVGFLVEGLGLAPVITATGLLMVGTAVAAWRARERAVAT
jgi:MFS family permease